MKLIGKIYYRASKKLIISWWTQEKHEFAVGHKKKLVISYQTLAVLFYYFRRNWREKHSLKTILPLVNIVNTTNLI